MRPASSSRSKETEAASVAAFPSASIIRATMPSHRRWSPRRPAAKKFARRPTRLGRRGACERRNRGAGPLRHRRSKTRHPFQRWPLSPPDLRELLPGLRVASGAKLVDRSGRDPNFSPTARFVAANTGGERTMNRRASAAAHRHRVRAALLDAYVIAAWGRVRRR